MYLRNNGVSYALHSDIRMKGKSKVWKGLVAQKNETPICLAFRQIATRCDTQTPDPTRKQASIDKTIKIDNNHKVRKNVSLVFLLVMSMLSCPALGSLGTSGFLFHQVGQTATLRRSCPTPEVLRSGGLLFHRTDQFATRFFH